MGALLIVGIIVVFFLLAPASAQGLLQSVKNAVAGGLSSVTFYVPTDADLMSIQSQYPEHGKYQTQALNSLRALQITTDLFNPNSTFCQNAGVAEARPVIGQQIGQGLQVADIAATIGSKLASIGSAALQLSTGALKAIPIIGSIVSGVQMAIGFIAAKHAAAVRKENLIACPVVPEINARLAQIDNLLRTRQVTGAGAMALLEQLQTNAVAVFSADAGAGIIMQLNHVLDGIIKVYALIIAKTGV